jgi:hypothetical protein
LDILALLILVIELRDGDALGEFELLGMGRSPMPNTKENK